MGKEFEIKDFIGMMPSKRKPPLNAAWLIENFDLREIDGDLHNRRGYAEQYAIPSGTSLSAISYFDYATFFVADIGGGQEIAIQVGKATLTSIGLTVGTFTDDILCVWASHLWNAAGGTWTDLGNSNWNWLNETVGTKIFGIDPLVAGDLHKVVLDIEDTGQVAALAYVGWYVYNINELGIFRVVDMSTWNDGTFDRVVLHLDGYADTWNPTANGKLLIQKNPIPYEVSTAIADDANIANKIAFHKVRDELRIGFGGELNKMGLSIQYQKLNWNVKSFDVEAFSSARIDTYCETDGLIITPYTLLTDVIRGVLLPAGSGALPADVHFGRVTGIMGSGDELLLVDELKFETNSPGDIFFNTFFKVAEANMRLKYLAYYHATEDGLKVYSYFGQTQVRSDTRETSYVVNNAGELQVVHSTVQIHDPSTQNAAAPVTIGDPLATTGWVASLLTAVADIGAGSINALNVQFPIGSVIKYLQYGQAGITNIKSDTEYDLTIWLKLTTGSQIDRAKMYFTSGAGKGTEETIAFTGAWASYTAKLKTPASGTISFVIELFKSAGGAVTGGAEHVRIDRLSIIEANANIITSSTVFGSEMNDRLGYTPTKNLVTGWDHAIVTQGRTWMVGVYIDKRYVNRIFRSQFSGAGGNMYDVLPAGPEGYYDVENFDGNDMVALEVLRNMDFLGLKNNSTQRIDNLTGRSQDLDFNGVYKRKGIVNLGSKVIYPGRNDIYASNGVQSVNITDGTIRNLYRALTDNQKDLIRAGRDEIDNAYRIFGGNTTTKAEYILTKKGWVSAKRGYYPIAFSTLRDGRLSWMRLGKVYIDTEDLADDGSTFVCTFQSVPFDAELLGESVNFNEIMIIESMFCFYSSDVNLHMQIFLDYKGGAYDTIDLAAGDYQKQGRLLKKAATCRSFIIKIYSDAIADTDYCRIHSFGFSLSKAEKKSYSNG